MNEWKINTEYMDSFYCTKEFNGYTYWVEGWAHINAKSIHLWIGASSGKKRRDLSIFEEKDNKSMGGIRALLWIKQMVLEFPEFYRRYAHGKQMYLCIGWADTRRRDIYERLKSEGFMFMVVDGRKCLMKKI